MTHWRRVRRRFSRSLRVRAAVLVLGLLALPGLFAEFVAADRPILAFGPSGLELLPAIVGAGDEAVEGGAPAPQRYRDATALWPLVRSGPDTLAAVGADAPCSWSHPLGTDGSGRDVVARLVYGARLALGLALGVLVLSLLLGVLLGAVAGYRGGVFDELLSRPVELIQTFPAIVVVAVVRAADPSASAWSLVLAIALVRWAEIARLVRAEVVRLNAEPFVLAARALGCRRRTIVWRHMLPHIWGPVAVSLMFSAAAIVLLEVAVSFLGLGLTGSWGALMAEGLTSRSTLWVSGWAALSLALAVGSAHLLADALSDALDARVASAHEARRWWQRTGTAP